MANTLANVMNAANEGSEKEKLLAELLNRYDAAANAKRKAQNDSEKLEYKVGDGDKSMIINRGSLQPKNIIDSTLRNESMQQEFLEKLHDITGDEELGEVVQAGKNKLALLAKQMQNNVSKEIPKAEDLKANLQGWAEKGQIGRASCRERV